MYQQQPPPQGMMGGYGYASDASYDSATYTGMSEQYINALAYGPFGVQLATAKRAGRGGRACSLLPPLRALLLAPVVGIIVDAVWVGHAPGRRSRSRGRQCRMHPLGVLATTGALCGLYLVYAARVNATLRRLQVRACALAVRWVIAPVHFARREPQARALRHRRSANSLLD
eukprot:scaffold1572_cov329-Prasinococcus_capsulatus_cf.AAC.4